MLFFNWFESKESKFKPNPTQSLIQYGNAVFLKEYLISSNQVNTTINNYNFYSIDKKLKKTFVFSYVQDTPSKKRMTGLEPSVFVCITLLGHAVKTLIKQDVKDLLEPMLATGLSPALTTSLRELATSIPQLKPDISEGRV